MEVLPPENHHGFTPRESGDQQKLDQTLSPKEMDIIKSLDSRSFGFLDLAVTSQTKGSSSDSSPASSFPPPSSCGTNFMSASFLKKGINMLRIELLSDHTSKIVQAKVLCHIAHLHLLLEEYTEALSAYQHCSLLNPDTSTDTSFLYGVGLIYFSFGKYEWALEAFHKVLLLAPDFARLNEVHVRMGLMLKREGHLQDALKHFVAALNNSGPCCITKLEMQFHVGHIHHINGDYPKAKQSFEWILASKNVPNDIKALTLRQLGWLYHTMPHIASQGERPHAKAVELLKLAVGANPESGQAWYFLGRCHADQGQYREAFMAYRQSVNKVENQPDTWCAIGILYQQMGQARDSLQAYITATFFNPTHIETWTDMGLLYESCGQLIDAFLCYKNGLSGMEKKTRQQSRGGVGFEGVQEILTTRVRFVEHQIQQSGGIAAHIQNCRNLPTLFESWSSLVPQHLREKYCPSEIPVLQLSPQPHPAALMSPGMGRNSRNRRIRSSKDPIILKSMNDAWGNVSPTKLISGIPKLNTESGFNHHLNPLLNIDYGNIDYGNINPQPEVFNPQIMYYNDVTMAPANGVFSPGLCSPQTVLPNETDSPIAAADLNINTPSEISSHLLIPPPFGEGIQEVAFQPNALLNPPHGNYHSGVMGTSVRSPFPFEDNSGLPQDLSAVRPLQFESQNVNMEDYLGTLVPSPQDIQNIQVCENLSSSQKLEEEADESITTSSNNRKKSSLGKRSRADSQEKASPSKMVARSPTALYLTGKEVSEISSSVLHDNGTVTSRSKVFSSKGGDKSPLFSKYSVNSASNFNSGSQSDTSSGVFSGSNKLSTSDSSTPSSSPFNTLSPVIPDQSSLDLSPDRSDNEIIPIFVSHPGLGMKEEYMQTNPFSPPSPPPADGNIELNPELPVFEVSSHRQALFTELQEFCTNPDLPICIIRGLAQAVKFDMNLFCTKTLMKQCGDHDVEIREQNLQGATENWDPSGKKQVWKCESSRSLTTVQEYGEYQFSVMEDEKQNKAPVPRKMLKFGTNCDLSDKKKWKRQLNEIKKLPKFLQVECPEANLLNHVGHTVLGMNTVQLYLKVPGCRTPGHQENNNFCSVNMNIGPGNCEWFAVPNKYWGVIHQLCEKNKICFLTGSWWPILEELKELKIPVYRFTQYEGEVVWINPGTVHWVQANSSCNNIAWNVGPLTAHQMRMCWERYQWNKVMKVRSIVPMITLTWNLAKKMKLANSHTVQQISSYLYSSYKQCEQLLEQLHNADIPVIWHGRVEGELTPTCTMCSEEVFNILFVSTNKKGDHLVHCHKCVQQVQNKNRKAAFTVLQQYTLTELQKTLSRYLPLSPSNKNGTRHSLSLASS